MSEKCIKQIKKDKETEWSMSCVRYFEEGDRFYEKDGGIYPYTIL